MIREGTGEPLVLLHGVLCSERVWRRVVPYLTPHHDVIALTALGHRGGNIAKPSTTISDLVDDIEATLDRLGVEKAHLAGNSMGGWMAIELARRGRAKSVCALSPAGCWDRSTGDQHHIVDKLRSIEKLTERTRWALPALARIGIVRRFAMRDNAVRGDRLTSQEVIDMADDLLGCHARDDLLRITDKLTPLDLLPCPMMLAWSECDEVIPPDVNGVHARTLFPQAEWRVLPKVGHIPMADNPKLVADTILESIQQAV